MKQSRESLFAQLSDVAKSGEAPTSSETWATGHGINEFLGQLFQDQVHIIHPDSSSIHSPVASDQRNALEGAVNYAKMIGGYVVNDEAVANGFKGQDGGNITRPIIMVINTHSAQAKSGADASAQGGVHWQCCVVLPKNYKPTFGAQLNNQHEMIFYIDSLQNNVKLPERLRFLLTSQEGLEYTFTSEGAQFTHKIPSIFPDAIVVDNIVTNQQSGGSDCGWWAVYNALMLVFSGNTNYLNQFQRPSREPAYKLRTLFPGLTQEIGADKNKKETSNSNKKVDEYEFRAIQLAIEASLKINKVKIIPNVLGNNKRLEAAAKNPTLLVQEIGKDPKFICSYDKDKLSLLHLASFKDIANIDSAKLLLDKRLDTTFKCKIGRTALHYACRWGHLDIAKLLIAHDPKMLDEKDDNQETPLDLAKREKHQDIVNYINQFKAELAKVVITQDLSAMLSGLSISSQPRTNNRDVSALTTQLEQLDLNSPYLDLDVKLSELGEHRQVVMAMAPINSSGDIYHMLAFTILSLHHKKFVPLIMLTYDKPASTAVVPDLGYISTGDQVKRAYNFVSTLGYKDYFRVLQIDSSGASYQARRQEQLEAALKKEGYKCYFDHRLSTTIISNHYEKYGFDETTKVLRAGLNQWEVSYNEASATNNLCKKKVEAYVEARLKEIKQRLQLQPSKPTVILHIRYAGKGANGIQNTDFSYFQHLTNFLQQHYNLIAIYADARKRGGGTLTNVSVQIKPFRDVIINDEIDLSKNVHLRLLLGIFEIRDTINLRGVIGTTSGTLDIAAFIGHKVLNIHCFSNPINYQDYRLFLQSTFLSIQERIEGNEGYTSQTNTCVKWLDTKQPSVVCLPIGSVKNMIAEKIKDCELLYTVCFLNKSQQVTQGFVKPLEQRIMQRMVLTQNELALV